MSTFCLIRRFINDLPPRRIFVTRELLAYGDRKSIDWLMCWMVREKELVRLARGVFIKHVDGMEMPSLQEIVEAKARAFAKLIIPTMENLAHKYRLIKPAKSDRRKKDIPDYEGIAQFSVIGCRGNFWTVHGRVRFEPIAPRKFFLQQEEKVGETILALWHATEEGNLTYDDFQRRQRFNRLERKRLMELSAWAPSWLQYYLYPEPPRADIHAQWSIFPMLKHPPNGKPIAPLVVEESSKYILKTALQGERHSGYGSDEDRVFKCVNVESFKEESPLFEYVSRISSRVFGTAGGGASARIARRNVAVEGPFQEVFPLYMVL